MFVANAGLGPLLWLVLVCLVFVSPCERMHAAASVLGLLHPFPSEPHLLIACPLPFNALLSCMQAPSALELAATVDRLREDVTASTWFSEFQADLRSAVMRALQVGGLTVRGSLGMRRNFQHVKVMAVDGSRGQADLRAAAGLTWCKPLRSCWGRGVLLLGALGCPGYVHGKCCQWSGQKSSNCPSLPCHVCSSSSSPPPMHAQLQGGLRGVGSARDWTSRNILAPAAVPFRACYARSRSAAAAAAGSGGSGLRAVGGACLGRRSGAAAGQRASDGDTEGADEGQGTFPWSSPASPGADGADSVGQAGAPGEEVEGSAGWSGRRLRQSASDAGFVTGSTRALGASSRTPGGLLRSLWSGPGRAGEGRASGDGGEGSRGGLSAPLLEADALRGAYGRASDPGGDLSPPSSACPSPMPPRVSASAYAQPPLLLAAAPAAGSLGQARLSGDQGAGGSGSSGGGAGPGTGTGWSRRAGRGLSFKDLGGSSSLDQGQGLQGPGQPAGATPAGGLLGSSTHSVLSEAVMEEALRSCLYAVGRAGHGAGHGAGHAGHRGQGPGAGMGSGWDAGEAGGLGPEQVAAALQLLHEAGLAPPPPAATVTGSSARAGRGQAGGPSQARAGRPGAGAGQQRREQAAAAGAHAGAAAQEAGAPRRKLWPWSSSGQQLSGLAGGAGSGTYVPPTFRGQQQEHNRQEQEEQLAGPRAGSPEVRPWPVAVSTPGQGQDKGQGSEQAQAGEAEEGGTPTPSKRARSAGWSSWWGATGAAFSATYVPADPISPSPSASAASTPLDSRSGTPHRPGGMAVAAGGAGTGPGASPAPAAGALGVAQRMAQTAGSWLLGGMFGGCSAPPVPPGARLEAAGGGGVDAQGQGSGGNAGDDDTIPPVEEGAAAEAATSQEAQRGSRGFRAWGLGLGGGGTSGKGDAGKGRSAADDDVLLFADNGAGASLMLGGSSGGLWGAGRSRAKQAAAAASEEDRAGQGGSEHERESAEGAGRSAGHGRCNDHVQAAGRGRAGTGGSQPLGSEEEEAAEEEEELGAEEEEEEDVDTDTDLPGAEALGAGSGAGTGGAAGSAAAQHQLQAGITAVVAAVAQEGVGRQQAGASGADASAAAQHEPGLGRPAAAEAQPHGAPPFASEPMVMDRGGTGSAAGDEAGASGAQVSTTGGAGPSGMAAAAPAPARGAAAAGATPTVAAAAARLAPRKLYPAGRVLHFFPSRVMDTSARQQAGDAEPQQHASQGEEQGQAQEQGPGQAMTHASRSRPSSLAEAVGSMARAAGAAGLGHTEAAAAAAAAYAAPRPDGVLPGAIPPAAQPWVLYRVPDREVYGRIKLCK